MNSFIFIKKIDNYISTLAGLLEHNNQTTLQELLVNSDYTVQEEYECEPSELNELTYIHAITFHVPKVLYYSIFDKKDEISQEIAESLNKIGSIHKNEYVRVFLEPKEEISDSSWRESSEALISQKLIRSKPTTKQDNQIWGSDSQIRIFISHKSMDKISVAKFKDELSVYGVACFVAHEDIEPISEWQKEIDKALSSMDVLLAWMTPEFSNSDWTDQEIGVAVGKNILVIPIRLGKDPYGLIGRYQAISASDLKTEELAAKVWTLLWKKDYLKPQLTLSLINTFEKAYRYPHIGKLMSCLELLENLSPELIDRLEIAPKTNTALSKAYAVKNRFSNLISRLKKGNLETVKSGN
jgi:hypothetical protein